MFYFPIHMPKIKFTMTAELPEAEELDIRQIYNSFENTDIDLICILGPTASGKTGYAVRLATEINRICGLERAEIISADSRQVYRGMDIGTGKDLNEYGEIPYHLIDIRPAGDKYNVYEYQKDFVEAFQEIKRKNGIPILCGGTGLYIEAATCGYDFNKENPCVDPSLLPHNTYYIGTLVSREERNTRIDKRLKDRINEGLVEEVQGLLDSGVSPDTLIYYGLEYKFVTQYLMGELNMNEMVTLLSNAIHQFAKRQMTWFRGMERDGIVIHWTRV